MRESEREGKEEETAKKGGRREEREELGTWQRQQKQPLSLSLTLPLLV